MKQKITVDRETARMLDRLLKQGHVASDGKLTRPLVRALCGNGGGKLIYHGYDQDAKKMVIAMRRQVKLIRKKHHWFDKVQYTLTF